MKDSYSFDRDEQGLEENYMKHARAYHRIFKRCGLKFYQVDSDPGMMGGAAAHEFMAPSPAGEDSIALCDKCGYAANTELAESVSVSQPPAVDWQEEMEEIATPEKRTIAEVSSFLKLEACFFIKSLLMVSDEGPFLALVRGDQELHEKKLQRIAGQFRPALKDEIKNILGVEAGFIGPAGCKLRLIADLSLKEGVYVAGANRAGYHMKGVRPEVHFKPEWHDIHMAMAGDGCPGCASLIKIENAIEIGNIFKLGTKYSKSLKAVYLDEKGDEKPLIMGSYGIGPARIAAAAIEQNNDRDGISWPQSIAPFDVELIPLSMASKEVLKVAGVLYKEIMALGLEVLMDDRDVRPGVKFKDADLIGIPWQIIIGEKSLKHGCVEIKSRRTGLSDKIPGEEAVSRLKAAISEK